MALPSSGPLSLADIQTEFGGSNPISLSEYYAGGGLVPSGTSGTNGPVPTSGQISIASFYGTTNFVARALFGLGTTTGGTIINVIDYVNIDTTGNATDFGDLSTLRNRFGAVASSTRGVFGGGPETPTNVMDYVTIASAGNATDFGDLIYAVNGPSGAGNSTRGIFMGGKYAGQSEWSQYITIASLGNSTDFGTLNTGRVGPSGSCASPTIAVIAGGVTTAGNPTITSLENATIATTSSWSQFGNLGVNDQRGEVGGCSSSTRGIFFGGNNPGTGAAVNVISYITFSSLGGPTDFGDLAAATNRPMGASSNTRGLIAGGTNNAGTLQSAISYVTIATLGNASSFGNLTNPANFGAGCSNAHGGLQ